MPKRTYQPKRRKRSRRLGFLATKKRKRRLQVVGRRRRKGRRRLTPTA
ncbi:MAG TPA: 50S ribosomal protein L34 [Candidatus Andersenbacteria bacterium]|nr:50S ribosomal protein L34 [Candidatus Andersenbacteria bacterium]